MFNGRRVVCIVQARLGSTRLPGKVLKTVGNKTLLEYNANRIRYAECVDDVIIATTHKDSDDKLAVFAEGLGCEIYRGSEDDVLDRYYRSAQELDLKADDIVIRVTSDCPLLDWKILTKVVETLDTHKVDYVRTDVPEKCVRGFDVEAFTFETLCKTHAAVHSVQKEIEKYELGMLENEYRNYMEHVTLYIYRHPEDYDILSAKLPEFFNENYRLCVDTIEDFNLIEEIYKHFNYDDRVTGEEIIKFLDENPKIAKINEDVQQKVV